MRFVIFIVLMISAASYGSIKARPHQCKTISLKFISDAGIEYPLVHFVKTEKIENCESDVQKMLSHNCQIYSKKEKSELNIEGKVSYHDGTRYHLATLAGSCKEVKISWRKN